jgi:hypothetical protein
MNKTFLLLQTLLALAACQESHSSAVATPIEPALGPLLQPLILVATVGGCTVYRGTDDVGQTFYVASEIEYGDGVACNVTLAPHLRDPPGIVPLAPLPTPRTPANTYLVPDSRKDVFHLEDFGRITDDGQTVVANVPFLQNDPTITFVADVSCEVVTPGTGTKAKDAFHDAIEISFSQGVLGDVLRKTPPVASSSLVLSTFEAHVLQENHVVAFVFTGRPVTGKIGTVDCEIHVKESR